MEDLPLLIVLSGPSGAGKDSVIRELRTRHTDIQYAVTATTRPPRPEEIPGQSYYFVKPQEYDIMLDRGELLAPALVHGHRYGAPIEEIRRAFAAGHDVLLKVDVQGAMALRQRLPQAIYIFLAPPSLDDLVARLQIRKTESGETLARRVRDATFEMSRATAYDYVVVNREGNVSGAARDIACIIRAEKLRTHRQPIVI